MMAEAENDTAPSPGTLRIAGSHQELEREKEECSHQQLDFGLLVSRTMKECVYFLRDPVYGNFLIHMRIFKTNKQNIQ